ncbi:MULTISPECIES: alpha/beta hydrolase-fold protein [unclassified Pseudomonas]|uniref:alpha/beta hydrolase n=1 Tax=unclassified Pseudomonas TaxID=196821 RepID=UPI00244B290D|nr:MULTISPECIES: alpha/beta hydrolase-fold protein [unclassified Pseudomonas]MDG9928752.1 alpha/beta hydrolase-fold protein [Pseudomonas sp. GD04042]MDH0481821.1 alpha/beta hydrolase-fold protein [Pseudomonas sp. GD04015]MDH0603193.1 alpha/beta hydrolase-fold protein [Pseudomonas sp. GD03869]
MRRLLYCSLLALLLAAPSVSARPDFDAAAGLGLAESGSAYYRFESLRVVSDDGRRAYRVWLALPKREARAAGHPVIYLLDGNASLEALQEDWLRELDALDPPVMVHVGYDSGRRFDVVSRAYDYTPPLPGVAPVIDDLARNREGGGADRFLDLLEQRIRPQVEARAAIDANRQSIWGHSYGGLFVMHTLFTRPGLFQTYIAAEPSLWWQQGFLLEEEKRRAASGAGLRLLILRGVGGEPRPAPAADDAVAKARRAAAASVPPDAAVQMARRLAAVPGLTVGYREFPGLGHGPMLKASLLPALRLAAGADDEMTSIEETSR